MSRQGVDMVARVFPVHKPLLGGARLGESGIRSFPVIIGLAGLGSFYASKSFDAEGEENTKMALKVLGFGAIGYSLFSIFSDFSSEAGASVVPEKPSAIPGVAEFSTVSGAFMSPVAGSEVPNSSGKNFQDSYDAKILLSNPAAKSVELIYQVVASEIPGYLFGLDAGWWNPKVAQVATAVVKLTPKEQRQVPLTLVPISNLTWLADGVSVVLTLQARRTAQDPWKTLSTVGFQYDRAGWN